MPFKMPSGRKVVTAGSPIIEEFDAEGVLVKPGRLAKKGTAATQVVGLAAATDVPAGWVGWDGEGAHPAVSPATRDTAYTAGKKVPVWYGFGCIGVGKLASGQNVAKDALLIGAADGELAAAATMTGATAAHSANALTIGERTHTTTLSGSIPAGGLIVAQAKEACDASAGAKDIIIKSLI